MTRIPSATQLTLTHAQDIMKMLDRFDQLAFQRTDEAGWIQLKWGITRAKAVRLIHRAREMTATPIP